MENIFFHENGGLIQGAPASPIIFHTYCTEMLDPNLAYFCKNKRLLITRYVDDILISSHQPITKEDEEAILEIIKKAELIPHRGKTRRVDNKFHSLVFAGIRICNHKVRPEDDFLEKLSKTDRENKSYTGMKNWEQEILALNQ